MCITLQDAKLAQTKAGVLVNFLTETHTLIYQNKSKNTSNLPNAMVLPILGKVVQNGFTDTTPFNRFVDDIVRAGKPVTRGLVVTFGGGGAKGVELHEVGKYTIVHAYGASVDQIQLALQQVPEAKRSTISNELLEWYNTHYDNPELVICCFSNTSVEDNQPIMVEYVPRDLHTLMIPGADSHDGKVPSNKRGTDRDHVLFVGEVHGNSSQVLFNHEIGEEHKVPFIHNVNFTQQVPTAIKNAAWASMQEDVMGMNCDWFFKLRESRWEERMVSVDTPIYQTAQ